jgi:putative N6-adenine-specific DNA methylase
MARKKRFEGEYKIYASDINPEMIRIAKDNVERAGQTGRIQFAIKDFKEIVQNEKLSGTIVTNPPYDKRLQDENIDSLYKNLDKLFRVNPDLKGGVITGYTDFDKLIKLSDYKKRKLYNG